VDGAGNVYFADGAHSQIKELPRAFVASMPRIENAPAGNDVLPPVVPATASLTGPFAPASDSSWLTITGITNGVVSFAFTANTSNTNRTAHITLLGQSIPVTQWPPFILGATNLVEGPAAFADSVVLATGATNSWTATANDSWLHLAGAYQSGVGSANVVFSFDTNSGLTRTGSITIGNQTLTVVQAGSGYVAAGLLTVIPGISQLQADQPAVAVDGAGNVYVSDEDNGSVDQRIPGNDTASSYFTGEVDPFSVAADQAGNLYIADFNNYLEKASLTSNSITTLSGYVMTGSTGYGMAVDGMGNVYIADTASNVVSQWSVNNQSVGILISSGLNQPSGVAVDAAGNLYIADTGSKSIKKWTASTGLLSSLITGFNTPFGVAVDGSGNVYVADSGAGVIYKWTAGDSSLAVLINGLGDPTGVAVDALGNVYVAAYNASDPVKELPRAFVNTSTRYESAGAGTDSLPPVLPYTESLFFPFSPNIEQSPDWINASSTNNGVISFSFGANSTNSSVRTAQYYLFGQGAAIIQQWVIAPNLLAPVTSTNGAVQFSFTNNQAGATFTVLSTTDLSLPLDAWTVAGTAANIGSGVFQFTSEPLTNTPQIFYSVSSP
jgi:sugar lactone lactonase YvrE